MQLKRLLQAATWAVPLAALAAATVAQAGGTSSGTPIDNFATVDYTVGGVPQTPVLSDTASFVVDNRVDLAVATIDAGDTVTVVPGDTARVLTFSVTNEGNTTQDYNLSAVVSGADDFNVTPNPPNIFVDNGDLTFNPADDTAAFIDELAADSTAYVFIVGDIPASQSDGDVATYDLLATSRSGGGGGSLGSALANDTGADIADSVQIVFADDAGSTDGNRDGAHSSTDTYKVVTADITVTKIAQTLLDPINGGSNPKAIPGATVLYSLDVDNTGSSLATNVQLVDAIPPDVNFLVGSVTSSPAATVEYSNDGGSTWGHTPLAGGDGTDPTVTHIRTTFASLLAATTGEVDFRVLIQ